MNKGPHHPEAERPPTNSRAVAAGILERWLATGAFPERLLERVGADRPFVMEMVYGTIKARRRLEWVLRRVVRHLPPPPLRAVLLVGLYQLLDLAEVASYAAVNETVTAARERCGRKSAGFVNAVLRNTLRQREALLAALGKQALGIRESHPDLLVERWTRRFGAAETERLCRWNNLAAETIIRVNRARIGPAEFCQRLADAGIRVRPHPFDPDRCVVLPRGVRVDQLPGFAEGWFAVQDPSTLVAVDLLAPRPGERVLDACAAPGGKTLAIAEQMAGRGVLVAADAEAERLARLRENLARLGADWVQVLQRDATLPVPERASELFDAVLLDAPCTNTGVLRRRPDARWRFSTARLAELRALQRRILKATAPLVRPGGRLVYSTCSLEREENEGLITSWLRHRPDFALIRERHLFPPVAGVDGGYVALLRRRA